MAKKTNAIPGGDTAPPQDTPSLAIYEVIFHSVQIGNLICYRTHRVKLTKEQADLINKNQPDTLKFIGI